MLAPAVFAAFVGAMTAGQRETKPVLISINWYVHLECEGCTHFGLDLGDGVTVLVPARNRVLQWTYFWNYPAPLEVGRVFADMAQKAYRVVMEPVGKAVWVTPIGLMFREPPPYPKWHGLSEAPPEFTEALMTWYDAHDLYAEDFAKLLDQLRFRRSVRTTLKISIKQAMGGKLAKEIACRNVGYGTQGQPGVLVPKGKPRRERVRFGA
jgi:hypothetical protein